MGSGEERLRPPFNLAAGAGLAGPPGPCGLQSSVAALPAAHTAAQPGHFPSPAVPGSTLTCPPPTTTKCPFSSALRIPHSRFGFPSAPPDHSLSQGAQHPCSRPRRTLSSHWPASSTAPSRGSADPQFPLFAAPGPDRDWAPSATERAYARAHASARTRAHTHTHTINAYTVHQHTPQETHLAHTYKNRATHM